MDRQCYLCIVFVMLSRLSLLALTFPCGTLVQVWYLIVSIPDLCRFSNFDSVYVMIF